MGLTLAVREFLDIRYEAFDICFRVCFLLETLLYLHYEVLHKLDNVFIGED